MSPSAKLLVALVALTVVAGVLAFTRPTRAADQRELTPAASYWMKRARAAEARSVQLAGVLAEARAAAKARRVTVAPSPVAAIRMVFGSAADRALRVARCETGGTLSATAANPSDRHSDGSLGSWGLFQIGSIHRAPGESVAAFRQRMFDPVANAQAAYRLSDGGRSFAGPWRTCGAGL